jgi:hypothetical protein
MMKKTKYILLVLVIAILYAVPALAQDLIVFPAKGQSDDQMARDKSECYQWAQKQTGFDPMGTPGASTPPPQQGAQQGGVVRGGARGAAVGAVGGAIAGDAGKGAAIGAATGALLGGMRRRDQQRSQQQAQQQWEQQQAAQYNQNRNTYNRAFGVCLEAKGYTVK